LHGPQQIILYGAETGGGELQGTGVGALHHCQTRELATKPFPLCQIRHV